MILQKKQVILSIKPYLATVLTSHPDLINYIDILPNGSNIIFRQSRIPQTHRQQYARLYRQATIQGRSLIPNTISSLSVAVPIISQNLGTSQLGSISSTSKANYLQITDSEKLARKKQQIIQKMKKAVKWFSSIEVNNLLNTYRVSVLLPLLLDYQRNFPSQTNKVQFLATEILIYGYKNNDLLFQDVIRLIQRFPLTFIQKSELYWQLVVGEYQKRRRSFIQAIELLANYLAYMTPLDRSEAWFLLIRSALLRGEVTGPEIRTYINSRNMVVPTHRAELQQLIS